MGAGRRRLFACARGAADRPLRRSARRPVRCASVRRLLDDDQAVHRSVRLDLRQQERIGALRRKESPAAHSLAVFVDHVAHRDANCLSDIEALDGPAEPRIDPQAPGVERPRCCVGQDDGLPVILAKHLDVQRLASLQRLGVSRTRIAATGQDRRAPGAGGQSRAEQQNHDETDSHTHILAPMGCESQSRNATAPAPGIAPGADRLDPARFARTYQIDSRIPDAVPGFDAPFFQAGLAGYSDAAMRIVARRLGCPYCITESLLDRTLLAGGRGFAKADLGELHDNVPGGAEDHPLAGQIMGCDPDEMAAAANKMVQRNAAGNDPDAAFQTIDVNLACPVKKIKRKARGGHWLREPQGAIDILQAVRDAVPQHIPVTVKMRRGFDDTPEAEANFYRIFDAAYERGCAWVTVHCRTVEQKYVGPSRWTFLRQLVESRPDRVSFGSGDIWSAEEIFRMIEYTGCHAVSVARGCIGNPWLFRQARQLMAGQSPTPPTIAEQREVLDQHFTLSCAVNGEQKAGLLMRKFGIRFATHHPENETVRKRVIAVKNLEDWRAVLEDHYSAEATVHA